MDNQKLIIVDGHAVIYRMWHVIRDFRTPEDTLVNAVFGFISFIMKMIENEKPTHFVVCLDHREKTFRHKKDKNYKAHRVKMPPEFHAQIPMIEKWLEHSGIHTFCEAGWEADDLIGTLTHQTDQHKIHSYIATADRDMLQILSPYTNLLFPRKGGGQEHLITLDVLKTEFGFNSPDEVPVFKGIVGDTSDNIPGIAGIGPKTAFALLARHGINLENILDDTEVSVKIQEKLQNGKEIARHCAEMATIRHDAPITFSIDGLKLDILSLRGGISILQGWGMNRISSRILRIIAETEHREINEIQDSFF